ncbi:MAG: hypothetical protein HOP30_12270 [Cyclobacteriaceae bacterium]|nr:hypothetical protein [Cyclobacteriaceae bacterium]
MKTFIALSTTMLLVIASLSMAAPKPGLTTLSDDQLFILKTTRQFKGGEVEVYSSSGYLVTSHRLIRRKMVIDFKNVTPGSYRIKVKKGASIEEFTFTKN